MGREGFAATPSSITGSVSLMARWVVDRADAGEALGLGLGHGSERAMSECVLLLKVGVNVQQFAVRDGFPEERLVGEAGV